MLERAVERQLSRGAEATRDAGAGGEVGARDVGEDEGERDRRVLARLASRVAGCVGLEGLWRG